MRKLIIALNADEIASSLEESLEFLDENEVRYVELRMINGRNLVNFSYQETVRLARFIQQKGFKVAAIASPLFKWYPTRKKRPRKDSQVDLFGVSPWLTKEEKKKLIRQVIKQAKILKTDKVRVFSGLKGDDKPGLMPESEKELMIYALEEAKKEGVRLLLENEPVCYVSKLDDYWKTLTDPDLKGLEAWFDIANCYQNFEPVTRKTLLKLVRSIAYLHIKDPVKLGTHEYVSVGKGIVNYKRIFSDLIELIDKEVFLSIETHVRKQKAKATQESLAYVRQLLSTRRVKYAVIGLGRVSEKHLKAIKANLKAELRGCYDIDKEKTKKIALSYDGKIYKSYEEVLADEKVEVVAICTPHHTHIELTKKALAAGKKILCEKPFALSSEELRKFLDRYDKHDAVFVVLQNRFNQVVERLVEMARSGKLGKVYYFSMQLRWWRDMNYFKDWHGEFKLSGGPLFTQAIHSIDVIRLVVGNLKINKIWGISYKTRQKLQTPDILSFLIELENGIKGTIEVCLATKQANLESSILVVGSKAAVKIGGTALSRLEFYQKPIETEKEAKHQQDVYGLGHRYLYQTLSNQLLKIEDGNSQKLARPADLLEIISFIEQCYDSLYS